MDYRSSRYMYENQQNIYSLIRLMILQEQNLRYMMSNNRPERTPERNSLNDQLSFYFLLIQFRCHLLMQVFK